MKKRWLSLLLVLTLVLAVCSVAAAAADAQKAQDTEQQAQLSEETTEAAQNTEEAAAADAAAADETQNAQENQDGPAEEQPNTQAETDAAHIHAVNREDACEEPAFEPLTVTGGVLESGCYYLTEDLALEQPLCVPKNGAQVTLCLNGHTLSLADGAEGCILFVAVSDADAEPSVLTITDCNGAESTSNYYVGEAGELVFDDGSFAWQEAYIAANEKNAISGGRITGATAGAISVGNYNKLYLNNVNIIDNEGRYGAGIVVAEHAYAVLDGCVIAGNRLHGEMKDSEKQIAGAGVYCAGTVELSGAVNIAGNRALDAQNNLWLDVGGTLTIGTLGLDKQARIGVTASVEQSLLSGYADDFSDNFFSDDPTKVIAAVSQSGFTDLSLQDAVYTLTLELGAPDEPVSLEAEQGKSLTQMHVQPPERSGAVFTGWYTADDTLVDPEQPLHLTEDTTFHAGWTAANASAVQETLLAYDPDVPLTKQEAVRTLYQMAKQLGADLTVSEDVDLTRFADADGLDEATAEAVRWAYAADLLSEKDGTLNLDESLSQKALSRMLEDFMDLLP